MILIWKDDKKPKILSHVLKEKKANEYAFLSLIWNSKVCVNYQKWGNGIHLFDSNFKTF